MRRAATWGISLFLVLCGIGFGLGSSPLSAATCAWQQRSTPSPGSAHNVLVAVDGRSTDGWAVGTYKNKGAPFKTFALRLTGDRWERVATPNIARRRNILTGVAHVDATNAWAVGGADKRDGTSKNLIVHWDGTGWSKAPAPTSGRPAEGLSAVDTAPLNSELPVDPLASIETWAVGITSALEGRRPKAQILHHDGTAWSTQAVPSPGAPHGLLSVIVFSPTDVWAAGFSLENNEGRPYVVRYDGTEWTIAPTPAPGAGLGGSFITAIGGTGSDDLWAVGFQGGGTPLVLRYDGEAWVSVIDLPPEAVNGQLSSVTVDSDGDVKVAGAVVKQQRLDTLMLHGSGGNWSRETTPNPATFNILADVAAFPEGATWAAGYRINDAAVSKPLLLRCG